MTDNERRVGKLVIQINGSELAPELLNNLDEMVVEDDLAQPAMFILRFNDPQFKLTDNDQQFRLGSEVKIATASTATGQAKTILTGEITALEPILEQHNVVLVVRGYDRSHRLHRGSKTRTFLKQADSDIIGQIARENGLRSDIEATGAQHEYVIQNNQTDMQFLRARAARNGYRVIVEDQKLKFRRIEEAPPKSPAQEWGKTLLSFRARLSAIAQPNEVQVRGWDPTIKRPLLGKASRPAQPSQVSNIKSSEKAAEQAFGSSATVVITDEIVRNQGEADKLAQSILDELSGDYLSAEATSLGDPSIRAGTLVELKEIGKRHSGTYFVTASRHVYTSAEGYITTFYVNGRRAGGLLAAINGELPRQTIAGVVIGIVTNNNDPENLGRVKLKFPWLDDKQESDWARLAAPGAGDKRGFLVVPEVDDEVLVAFEQGDMNRPYVVGGLWNGKDKPPKAGVVEGGKVQHRVFKTRAGHSITISDKDGQGQIEIKTSKQTITLDDKGLGKVTIESGGDLEIKAAGGKLSIGAAGVELSADAILTIKGQLVKIN